MYAHNAWVISSKVRGQVGLEGCIIFVVKVDGSETLLAGQKNMHCLWQQGHNTLNAVNTA